MFNTLTDEEVFLLVIIIMSWVFFVQLGSRK